MQDSDSLGRNGKSEGILESFFFFFESVGLMVGRGGKKARLIILKRILILFF